MEEGVQSTLTSEKSPKRSRAGSLGHKRNTSGGGLLSRIPFLRTSSEDQRPSRKSIEEEKSPDEEPLHHTLRHEADPAVAAIRQHKSRKRKGSLRKDALLGIGRLNLARRTSIDQRDWVDGQRSPPNGAAQHDQPFSPEAVVEADDDVPLPNGSSAWALPPPNQPLKLDTLTPTTTNGTTSTTESAQLLSPESVTSPITSPTYASTTSDDDALQIPSSTSIPTRRRSTLRNPILPSPIRSATSPPPHSYSETEWWGWIILLTTWIVFVVGMGSCLGVWSWAWDVGETPYAPPELEDDATLPIVGYYPALFVCTGVMAWVWCMVSWVGMKYFRHARFDQAGPVGGND